MRHVAPTFQSCPASQKRIVWSPAAAGDLFSVRVSADPQTFGTALQT